MRQNAASTFETLPPSSSYAYNSPAQPNASPGKNIDSRRNGCMVRTRFALLIVHFAFVAAAWARTSAADPPVLPAPPLSALEAQYLDNVRQVTYGLPRAGEGYFSPDGKSIVYQAFPVGYPFYQIYTQSL